MKPGFLSKFLVGLLLLAGCVVALNATADRYFYPSPERKSAFIQSYSPKDVVRSFEKAGFNSWTADSNGLSAGLDRVTNDYETKPTFVMDWERRVSLMDALHRDMKAQLEMNRAQLIGDEGDAENGFRLTYKVGKIIGRARIQLLVAKSDSVSNSPLPAGERAVTPQVSISEEWFPTEVAASQAIAKTL